MQKIKTYRFFQFAVMAYLVSAFGWWTILLLQKNKEIYQLKAKVSELSQSEMTLELQEAFVRSKWMIIGEGFVLAISIIVSLILINRAFWTEIKTNKKLNNFLLSVTHELKTPIASLKLISETLITKNIPEEKSKSLMLTASGEIRRLESLVNNILTVTHFDNNYLFNFEAFNLAELVQSRINRIKSIYPEYAFQLVGLNSQQMIFADYESITKLVDNLIDNAIKYSEEPKIVYVSISTQANKVSLEVADNGIGINDIEKTKILDKFYRIGNEDVRSSKGTGLGLFIVKEICKAHQAQIEILDNHPKGSIFRIIFKGIEQ